MPYIKTTKIRDLVFCEDSKPQDELRLLHPVLLSAIMVAIVGVFYLLGIVGIRTTLQGNYSVVKAIGYGFIALIGFLCALGFVSIFRSGMKLKRIAESRPAEDAWYVIHNDQKGWLVFRNGWMIFQCDRYTFRLSAKEIGDLKDVTLKWIARGTSNLVLPHCREGYAFSIHPLIVPAHAKSRFGEYNVLQKQMLESMSTQPKSGAPLYPPLPPVVSGEQRRLMIKQAIINTLIIALPPSVLGGFAVHELYLTITPQPKSAVEFSLALFALIGICIGVNQFQRVGSLMAWSKFNESFTQLTKVSRVEHGEQWEEPISR